MSQLGRITGPLLKDVLTREDVDLKIVNTLGDTGILYFDVDQNKVGINKENPVYDLDINNDIFTTNFIVTDQANVDNIIGRSGSEFSTSVGSLNIVPQGINPEITHQQITSDDLYLNDNIIGSFSDSDIQFEPSGSGKVQLLANTQLTGNLSLSGNITLDGNLSTISNIVIGDSPLDVVVITPELNENLDPGQDNTYDLGQQANDSSPRRWSEIWVEDISNVDQNLLDNAIVSSQLAINGGSREILATQSNEDIELDPYTGITFIERLKFESNTITNLDNTPLQFQSTGIGYTRFMGTNGFVMPAGNNASRPSNPELADTRWNTQEQYLECFDGNVYVIATGGGEEVTEELMEDLGNVYSLILG